MTRMSTIPTNERPRERLLAAGAGTLSEQELLAVLLGSGVHGASALDVAAALLSAHGSLVALAAAPPGELALTAGLGPAKAAMLAAAFQLGRLAASTPADETGPRSPDQADVRRSASTTRAACTDASSSSSGSGSASDQLSGPVVPG